MGRLGLHSWVLWCALCLSLTIGPARAETVSSFVVPGASDELADELRGASLTLAALEQSTTDPADLVSAALADYRRLVETLYASGHYSGSVRIRLNGREAADIPLLSLPARIDRIAIEVAPGPLFRFGAVSVTPVAPGTALVDGFRPGEPARATLIRAATQAVISGWRDAGHAKAEPGTQRIVADHRAQTLSADIRVIPGPQVRFGELNVTGPSAVRASRLRRISGLPEGEVFSPSTVSQVGTRLRRTGTFSSVTLEEGAVNPDGTMDIDLTVVDRMPRRYGFGAELSSREGLDLSAFWMHRNLFGGAERLRIEGEIAQIGGQDGDPDFLLGARLDFPAAVGADTNFFLMTELERLDERRFRSDRFEIGAGVTWYARDGLEAEAAVTYLRSETEDALGTRDFSLLTFPTSVSWDRRDDALNPTVGTYLRVEATPYLGLSGSATGARAFVDARGYRGLNNGRFVLAGRLQLGSIMGSSLRETYPDFLFFSGGGGTVRGQPFQSLEVDLGGGQATGGRSFMGAMVELRAGLTDTLGAVLFTDAGYVGPESFVNGAGEWHAGAGIGLRYDTGIGPIRVDVAAPVHGDTGDGVQVYIGIGQAF